MARTQGSVLIIGGNGKTGRRVDALLRERGVPTTPVSRSTTPAFDWNRPAQWSAALEGASKAYITYQPDLAVESSTEAIAELSRVARKRGLERLVLLSGRGEPGAQRAEAALQASGVPWTIIRASWFSQNFSEGYLRDGVLAGVVALPVGAIPEPFIDVDDIAEVAAAALLEERHANRLYEVTGPRALSFAEAVGEISRVLGRPISFVQMDPEEFAINMRPHVPEEILMLLLDLFRVVLDGRNTPLANGVEQALGRPPRDFTEFVRKAAEAGAWRAAA
jgi:uncharacterized protein YbjT (DUF2867 family)